MLFKREKLDLNRLPQHIAFIMDGNGRWAKHRGMPRVFGHKVGVDALIAVITYCAKLGIKVVSFYAFSTENWKRDKEEVNEIFRLVKNALKEKGEDFLSNNLRLNIMGDLTKFDDDMRNSLQTLAQKSSVNTGMVVNIGLNYGSRAEIVHAVNNILSDGLHMVDEATFSKYLYTSSLPDPDLIIRTSGEMRLSNFMLYQSAYSEFYFPKIHWPAFREREVDKAIIEYQKRDRRFGNVKK